MERSARHDRGELRDLLERGADELGASLSAEARGRLIHLAELVAAWGRRLNLSGHTTPEAVLRRLVLDALALSRALPPFSSAADVGSGAGFPGLAWAASHPERRITSIEARQRRHHFQRAVIRELGLANAAALWGRAEDLAPEHHDLAVAQAVARPARALAWILPWAGPGGLLALPGGAEPPDPGSSADPGGIRVLSHVSYRVPLGGPLRTVWLARRNQREPAG